MKQKKEMFVQKAEINLIDKYSLQLMQDLET